MGVSVLITFHRIKLFYVHSGTPLHAHSCVHSQENHIHWVKYMYIQTVVIMFLYYNWQDFWHVILHYHVMTGTVSMLLHFHLFSTSIVHTSCYFCVVMFTKRSCQDISYVHKSLSHEYSILLIDTSEGLSLPPKPALRGPLCQHLDGEYLLTLQEILPHTSGLLTFYGFASLPTIRRMGRGTVPPQQSLPSIHCFTIEDLLLL